MSRIRPDLIVGTSVGAVNGAWIAGEGDIEELLDACRTLRRADVFPTRPVGGLLGFLGRSDHLFSDGGLRRLLSTHLRFSDLEDAATPLHVVATDLLTVPAWAAPRFAPPDSTNAVVIACLLAPEVSPATEGTQQDAAIRRQVSPRRHNPQATAPP